MTLKMTYATAHAAGWDAGNRSMVENGRVVWNEDDANRAAQVMNELMGPEDGLADGEYRAGCGKGKVADGA